MFSTFHFYQTVINSAAGTFMGHETDSCHGKDEIEPWMFVVHVIVIQNYKIVLIIFVYILQLRYQNKTKYFDNITEHDN